MMGRQQRSERPFYDFRLEEPIPPDHLLRKLDRLLDLSLVRGKLAEHYRPIGRPSVDPELLLRVLLVGCLYGIRSERRPCEEVHLNLAYRRLCKLGLDTALCLSRRRGAAAVHGGNARVERRQLLVTLGGAAGSIVGALFWYHLGRVRSEIVPPAMGKISSHHRDAAAVTAAMRRAIVRGCFVLPVRLSLGSGTRRKPRPSVTTGVGSAKAGHRHSHSREAAHRTR